LTWRRSLPAQPVLKQLQPVLKQLQPVLEQPRLEWRQARSRQRLSLAQPWMLSVRHHGRCKCPCRSTYL
jgi:hypothetical protein